MAFYPKIKSLIPLLSIIILNTTNVISQNTGTYWQVDYGYGSILKHKKLIGHLVIAHPQFFSINWQNNARADSKWRKRYNYPDWGISISYQNFNNPTLGNNYGLQYQTTYYLLNRNIKHQLNFQFRTGLAYNTNPLDLADNTKNVVMSSHLQLAEFLKFEYKYPNLIQSMGLHIGLLFTHYSNASYKKPNFGINSVFLSAGLDFQTQKCIVYPNKSHKGTIPKQPIHYSIATFIGAHEAKAGLGTKAVYTLSAYANKKIGQLSILQAGIDFFNSQSVKRLADFWYHTKIEYPDRKLLDHKQIGVFVGHELLFNKISLETSIGYYLYHPLKYIPSVYQKIGLKHHLNSQRFALSLNLKTHIFRAEYMTLGIHYKLL